MKQLLASLLIPIIASVLFAQSTVLTKSTVLTNTTKLGAVNLSHQVTGDFGGTMTANNDLDSGDAGYYEASGFSTCPAWFYGSCPATPTLLPTCYIYADTTDGSSTFGCALYADNGNTPVGGALVCGGTTTSNPGTVEWLAISMTSCPSTLSTNAKYWVSQYTSSSGNVGTSGEGSVCAGSTGSFQTTSGSQTPWPGTFPAAAINSDGCYSAWVQLTYLSTQTFDVIAFSEGSLGLSNTGSATIATFQAGHKLRGSAMNVASGGFVTLSSITDPASDTIGTVGSTGAGSGNYGNAFFSGDSITTSTNTLTFTWSNGNHPVVAYAEVSDSTCSSSCYDTSGFDTAFISSPFTSAVPTSTLSRAVEWCLGSAWNDTLSALGGGGTFAATSPWVLFTTGQNSESAGNISSLAFFNEITSSTSAQALSGTWTFGTPTTCISGTACNLPSLACWK